MTSDEMMNELHEIVKTPDDEIMVLPFGNSDPREVTSWLIGLSDDEFDVLMQLPIIIQAKVFYRKIRNEFKEE